MNRRLAGVAIVLGVAFGLATACTGDSGSATEMMAPRDADAAGDVGAGEAEQDGRSTGPGAVARKEVSQPGVDRALVRTATVQMTADDVGDAVDGARDIAAAEGGYAGRERVREASATLTLHIPSDRFDRALDRVSGLGEVISREQTAEDVTEQVVDLDSRIATQRASVDRVRALLARANTVDEIVRIEQEVTSREADLESLQQRRQVLAGQVAMSTVTIGIDRTDAPAPPKAEEERGGFLAGLSDGWAAFTSAGAGTLRVIGAVLPFALVIGVPAVFLIRWWRRRRTTAPAQP